MTNAVQPRQGFYRRSPRSETSSNTELCEWAVRTAKGDVDEAGRALRAWAKKHGAGLYNPSIVGAPELTWEQTAQERRVREAV